MDYRERARGFDERKGEREIIIYILSREREVYEGSLRLTQGGRRKNKEGRTCTYVDRRRVLTSLNIMKGYVIKLNIRKGLLYKN